MFSENRNSNSSQPPTNTIAKNTTHMGATHSLRPTNHILMQFIRLSWRLNKNDLPTNFILSKRQLNSLLNSLNKKYNEQFFEQVNLGFMEKVRNLNLHEGILHCIPHFPVFKTDSATTKMRTVYYSSARVSSAALSLKDCLHTGPNLMQDRTGILSTE